MITYKADIALYAKRDIHFKDSVMVDNRESPPQMIAPEGGSS
jgi:hypothetical protein